MSLFGGKINYSEKTKDLMASFVSSRPQTVTDSQAADT